jgi:hypothetical protein
MDDDQLTGLRTSLRAWCDRQPRGTVHVALARTAFDQAIFHLQLHREKLAVVADARGSGDSGAVTHAG